MPPSCSLISALAMMTSIGPASAALVTELGFGTLPSQQGWTFTRTGNHGSVAETTAFTATPDSLLQTTIGLAMNSGTPGSISYEYYTSTELAEHDTISIFFRTAVTAHQQTRQDFSYAAHRFTIVHNGRTSYVGIKPGELYLNGSYFTPTGFNGAVQNDYRLTLNTADQSAQFYWNGNLVSDTAAPVSGSTPGFYLFDGTGTANADAELTRFVAVSGTVIPEPSTTLVVIVSGSGFLLRRARRG